MPKPNSKETLLTAANDNYNQLIEYIDQLDPVNLNKEFPKQFLNRNVRDIVAHIHHWHLLFLGWYKEGMKGKKPAMPADGYTWKTLPELNKQILAQYSNMSLKEARKLLKKSHAKVYAIIKKHTEEELFTKKKYVWTGSTSLGVYLISNSSSHYNWGKRIIKKGLK